ncbi:MAG: sulfurtransferase [Gammaproteobacteria bacterium]|nr:sulfurtransferase [Gammaproteobacteria bacterium]
MAHTTLITAEELAQNLDDSSWVIFDCRFSLANVDRGERSYNKSHIPGAYYAHLDRDLCSPKTPELGRHPLPDPEEFAAWLGQRGVTGTTQVVAYDDAGAAIAGRLWWMLRWLGHDNVAVLDGGWRAWQDGEFPADSTTPELREEEFTASPRRDLWLDTDQVVATMNGGRDLIVDARAPERYAGILEPLDPVAGHVPGAVNLPFAGNLDGEGRFLTKDKLKKRLRDFLKGISAESVVNMCGSGVTACQNILAMEHAGLKGSRLYVGSWSAWISNGSRPIAVKKDTRD